LYSDIEITPDSSRAIVSYIDPATRSTSVAVIGLNNPVGTILGTMPIGHVVADIKATNSKAYWLTGFGWSAGVAGTSVLRRGTLSPTIGNLADNTLNGVTREISIDPIANNVGVIETESSSLVPVTNTAKVFDMGTDALRCSQAMPANTIHLRSLNLGSSAGAPGLPSFFIREMPTAPSSFFQGAGIVAFNSRACSTVTTVQPPGILFISGNKNTRTRDKSNAYFAFENATIVGTAISGQMLGLNLLRSSAPYTFYSVPFMASSPGLTFFSDIAASP
jgi:hypothetical protein